jgi:predicted NUDIX family phosphoesterase
MSKMDEVIIVVPRRALFANESLTFQGTETEVEVLNKLKDNIQSNFGVMRRGDAEENENFKQPIPYAVIRRGNKIFVYERLSGGGEAKLHGKLSIGAGGHMNFEDSDFMASLRTNLERELNEELDIDSDTVKLDIVGFINDDENSVGRVHIGVLVIIDIDKNGSVEVREKDTLKGDFLPIRELSEPHIYDRLENWSKIVVDMLSK